MTLLDSIAGGVENEESAPLDDGDTIEEDSITSADDSNPTLEDDPSSLVIVMGRDDPDEAMAGIEEDPELPSAVLEERGAGIEDSLVCPIPKGELILLSAAAEESEEPREEARVEKGGEKTVEEEGD